jgi:hypothetical protein
MWHVPLRCLFYRLFPSLLGAPVAPINELLHLLDGRPQRGSQLSLIHEQPVSYMCAPNTSVSTAGTGLLASKRTMTTS